MVAPGVPELKTVRINLEGDYDLGAVSPYIYKAHITTVQNGKKLEDNISYVTKDCKLNECKHDFHSEFPQYYNQLLTQQKRVNKSTTAQDAAKYYNNLSHVKQAGATMNILSWKTVSSPVTATPPPAPKPAPRRETITKTAPAPRAAPSPSACGMSVFLMVCGVVMLMVYSII